MVGMDVFAVCWELQAKRRGLERLKLAGSPRGESMRCQTGQEEIEAGIGSYDRWNQQCRGITFHVELFLLL